MSIVLDLLLARPVAVVNACVDDAPAADSVEVILRRPEGAVICLGPKEEPAQVVLLAMQMSEAPSRRESWARQVAELWLDYRCAVNLVVLCPDDQVAAWAAEPIVTGFHGYELRPRVFASGGLSSLSAYEHPELAIVLAMLPGLGGQAAESWWMPLRRMADSFTAFYVEAPGEAQRTLVAALDAAVETEGADLMTYLRDWVRGFNEGRAESVLRVLETRGMTVSDDVAARVRACMDTEQLRDWLIQAISVDSVDELLPEAAPGSR
ncbi:hypothetical protein [Nonomuraea roseola]|uniref:Uncharacterized protein n=1 Tax=Nonomuraea roseola TaxID=46179 RepID=A0ABV5PYK5_9ACTN